MLFHSLEFIIFFPVVVAIYFLAPLRFRQFFLLLASYYFYMCWKAEYAVLILLSTGIDYVAALRMHKTSGRGLRKMWLGFSLAANLGVLFFFKYANFFSASARSLLQQANIFYEFPLFDILLPVGISFYTFQTLSYTIDVYRGEKTPERNFIKFALYVTFFPQLVAGPIERSTRLLPQFDRVQKFDANRVVSGLRLMLWGFFKKLVIADRLALYVNEVYNNPADYTGLPVILATYFFAFQIYCDFSAYSDIAIGAARVLGFDLMKNFRQPYLAQSIGEFWKRWHISLSTWFRDYLYIPLGGNRVGKLRWYYNLMAVFVISGLWHGANWTFVVWGALHGSYFVLSLLTQKLRAHWVQVLRLNAHPRFHTVLKMAITFHLVLLAWIFFRANSLTEALLLLQQIFRLELTAEHLMSANIALNLGDFAIAFASLGGLLLFDLLDAQGRLGPRLLTLARPLRWAVYYSLILAVVLFGVYQHIEFIYFQF